MDAQALARSLASGKPALLDIQRVFSLLPPEKPLGEALFRLVEAFGRTPDRAGRRALVDEFLHPWVPLLPVDLATDLVGRQFVYAGTIEEAVAAASRNRRNHFSFDMLGEGARTAADAERYFRRYLVAVEAAGRDPRFGVSVKLSSLHPRYDAAGFAAATPVLLERLRSLCRVAEAVNVGLTIDAEESERLPLQLDVFAALCRTTQWPGLGLAVQAYRREVLDALRKVIDLARQRGSKVNVRLVKGAYWDAEIKRAQELGVERYPVFTDKHATDRAYLEASALLLENADAVFPQFATHNPATAAGVLALAEGRGAAFEFQRLHGMGAALDRSFEKNFPGIPVRIYAPVGRRPELLAYLVRRLLENGANTSYVRRAAADPSRALDEDLTAVPNETLPPPRELHMPERITARGHDLGHRNELEAMAKQVREHRRAWTPPPAVDPREAIGRAHAAHRRWADLPAEQRAALLERAGDLLEADTPELIALCVWEAHKTLADALADVREAIDFCRYYAVQARKLLSPQELKSPAGERNVLTLHGRGVFACISPWNFPVAIFTGQVAAALVTGNTVVAKPAEQTPLAAHRVHQLFLQAGIPADAFQLVPGDGKVGQAIVGDPRIAGVVFTGSTDTAKRIQRSLVEKSGPLVPFIAETGGLNAMIVDSTALPEQVVDAVVASAFRTAGQRCSSLRMLYLQNEIAPAVLELLRGAMAELKVGDPSDPSTDVGPLIDADARDSLSRYVQELRKPVIAEAKAPAGGNFLAPVAFEVSSIKDLPGERFGPILHVARFAIEDLDRVIDDINSMGYGLTMGVHTRIDSRAEHIRQRAAVGNLYVNRNTIGAVVGVQPFGGEGLSGTGPKAGGPHYLARFCTERVFTVNTAAAGGDLRLLTGGT